MGTKNNRTDYDSDRSVENSNQTIYTNSQLSSDLTLNQDTVNNNYLTAIQNAIIVTNKYYNNMSGTKNLYNKTMNATNYLYNKNNYTMRNKPSTLNSRINGIAYALEQLNIQKPAKLANLTVKQGVYNSAMAANNITGMSKGLNKSADYINTNYVNPYNESVKKSNEMREYSKAQNKDELNDKMNKYRYNSSIGGKKRTKKHRKHKHKKH